jgi:hypothetical protein
LGVATGYSTVTFDAPGAGQFLSSLQQQGVLPASLYNGAAIQNYRLVGDHVSFVGTQIGSMTSIATNTVLGESLLDNHDIGRLVGQLEDQATEYASFPETWLYPAVIGSFILGVVMMLSQLMAEPMYLTEALARIFWLEEAERIHFLWMTVVQAPIFGALSPIFIAAMQLRCGG